MKHNLAWNDSFFWNYEILILVWWIELFHHCDICCCISMTRACSFHRQRWFLQRLFFYSFDKYIVSSIFRLNKGIDNGNLLMPYYLLSIRSGGKPTGNFSVRFGTGGCYLCLTNWCCSFHPHYHTLWIFFMRILYWPDKMSPGYDNSPELSVIRPFLTSV